MSVIALVALLFIVYLLILLCLDKPFEINCIRPYIQEWLYKKQNKYCANCAHQILGKELDYGWDDSTYCSLNKLIKNIYSTELQYRLEICQYSYCTKNCKWKKREEKDDV